MNAAKPKSSRIDSPDAGVETEAEAESTVADSRNPMIGFHWTNTVSNVECAATFLARVHHDIADIEEQCPAFLGSTTHREKRGLASLLDCMAFALRHALIDGQKGGAQ